MRPQLHDAPVVHDRDAIGPHGGGEPVRDQDRCAAFEQRVETTFDLGLTAQVEVGGRLVEHEDPGPGEERAGECEQLTLARGERRAALVHERVEPVRQPLDQLVEPDRAARLVDFGVGGVRAGERHVRAHRTGEEERFLRHDTELAAQ